MAVVIAEHELMHSCRVLFGTETTITRAFLEYLQPSGIKCAYRKKALETHPDVIARQCACNGHQSSDLFRAVQQAYENLKGYMEAREQGFTFRVAPRRVHPTPTQTKPSARAKRSTSTGYQWHTSKNESATQRKSAPRPGASRKTDPSPNRFRSQTQNAQIPARPLLFGHFLYYTGITDWQTIIKAIVWQRTERPKIGELAKKYGWLSNHDILHILRRRNLSDSFGKSAVNMGFINDNQLRILLFHQKRMQKKFGQYFVQNNLLTPFELQSLVSKFYSHNSNIPTERVRSYCNRT